MHGNYKIEVISGMSTFRAGFWKWNLATGILTEITYAKGPLPWPLLGMFS